MEFLLENANTIPIGVRAGDPETEVDMQQNKMVCIIHNNSTNISRIEFKGLDNANVISFHVDMRGKDILNRTAYNLRKVLPVTVKGAQFYATLGLYILQTRAQNWVENPMLYGRVQIGIPNNNLFEAKERASCDLMT